MNFKSLMITVAGLAALASSASAEDSYFDSNGVKIRYVTEGKGEAIVLIHGWLSDATMWGKDAYNNPRLEHMDGYEVIALDCRGHGKSDKPHDPTKYGVEMAEDVVRLLDHLKIKKAHLIGYSMGSFIAGKVAAMHPDRLISVIYGGQAPIIKGAGGGASDDEVDVFAKAVDEGKGLGPYLMYVWPTDRPKPTMAVANSIADYLYKGKDVKALAVAGLSLGALAVTREDLVKCKAPSLFIYGGKESDYVKNGVAAAQKLLANSEVKVIKGGDHITTLANPDFGLSVVNFIRAHKGS